MPRSNPEITLIVSKLFEPLLLWSNDFLFNPKAPFLSQLLSHYDVTELAHHQNLDACLFASLGFSEAELPSAVYRLQSHHKIVKKWGGVFTGGDRNLTGKQLLCADPVHLEVGINDITLTERITDLSEAAAIEMIDALNAHFSQDGFEFIYGSERQWYLALDADETLSTTPVDSVVRKNIVQYLPQSKGVNWKLIQNEVQMLLHSLPVNTERLNDGLPMVNSLWFWGGGRPQESKALVDSVLSTSQSKGFTLAQAAGCDCDYITPESDIKSRINTLNGHSIFILEKLYQAAIHDDIDTYQQQLSFLDEAVIKPLYFAWKADELRVTINGCDGHVLTPVKASPWKFWSNKPKSLVSIAKEISR